MRVALRKRGDVIAKKATTIAIVNQKGGTAKTTTCENLGIGLAMEGKKVLLVDVDPQGSLTISMGWQQPDELSTTLSTLMQKAMNDQPIQPGEGILHHAEGVDLIPANIELAGMEVALVNSMNREKMLKQVLDSAKREYDYSSIKFELSFVNMATDSTEFEKSIRIPFQKDGFDDVRAEYSQMLRQQLAKGNNGLTKTKFITFGVEGESMQQVKTRLDHIQNDLLNNFHRLGVLARPLNGAQRLKLMHDMFNMDGSSKFHFDWNDLVKSGLSVKDAIAPTAFAFKNSRTFQMGGIYCAASFLSITASDLSDQLLKDFLDMDSSQIVTMHIQSVDQNRAIKTVKRTITELDRSKIEEQKKAICAGYDIDIIPSDLATYGRDAKALLKELQSQNERMHCMRKSRKLKEQCGSS